MDAVRYTPIHTDGQTDRQTDAQRHRERVGDWEWETNTCDQLPESPIEYHRNRNTTYVQKFVRLIKFDSGSGNWDGTGLWQWTGSGRAWVIRGVSVGWAMVELASPWPVANATSVSQLKRQSGGNLKPFSLRATGHQEAATCYATHCGAAGAQRAGSWNSCSNFCSISFDLVIWH